MKLFGGFDTAALKQHFGKKIVELEEEKRAVQVSLYFSRIYTIFVARFCSLFSLLQQERDSLLAEVENLSACSDGQTQKLYDIHSPKLRTLEAQVIQFLPSQNALVYV